jgi:hypothetical protein
MEPGPMPATSRAAELLDMSGQLGVIAPGAYADIIAVNGNPLRDVKVLEDVRFDEGRLGIQVTAGYCGQNALTCCVTLSVTVNNPHTVTGGPSRTVIFAV